MGRRWDVEEVFVFRGGQKHYRSRAVDQHGQVLDILLRDKRDRARAGAFFRRALRRTGTSPHTIMSDYNQPYTKAVASVAPNVRHIRTGLQRTKGETTKPVERSHVAIRDRWRCSRGLKTVVTGQRFFKCFKGMHAVRRGYVKLRDLVGRYRPTQASPHETTRAVMVASNVYGTQLRKAV